MTKLIDKIEACFADIQFSKINDNIDSLAEIAKQMAANAGTDAKQKFEALPSYIPAEDSGKKLACVLSIDIGGTSTKAGVRLHDVSTGYTEWKILFELKNLDMQDIEFKDKPFVAFCKILASYVEHGLVSAGIPKDKVNSCGLVWSNAMENKSMTNNRGITGIVCQLENYKKGEWFNEGLSNGVDLGEEFFKAFKNKKINLNKIVLANDTVLTMKALNKSHSGMVASTGLNTTLLKTEKELSLSEKNDYLICNSELGGRFILPHSLLTEADYLSKTQRADTIEYLTTGNFLPKIFTNYIHIICRSGFKELLPLSEYLSSLEDTAYEEFRSKDLSLLNQDRSFFINRRTGRELYTDQILDILNCISQKLIIRAGKLCALVAATSVSNLPDSLAAPDGKFLISLDSRLAREIPIFWKTLKVEAKNKNFFNKNIQINLQKPLELENGKISVPMLGAANAVDVA